MSTEGDKIDYLNQTSQEIEPICTDSNNDGPNEQESNDSEESEPNNSNGSEDSDPD